MVLPMKRTSQRSHEKKSAQAIPVSEAKERFEAIAPIQSEDLKRDITDYGEVGSGFQENPIMQREREAFIRNSTKKEAPQGYQHKEGGRAEEIQGGHEEE